MARILRLPGAVLAAALAAAPAATPRASTSAETPSAAALAAAPLSIALSTRHIEINSSFTGTSILLFGAVGAEGDVVVTVRGPEAPMVVRRKRRAAGIWINRDSVAFRDVPQYYAVAASRPLAEAAPAALRARERLGADRLPLEAIWIRTADDADAFRDALRRHKRRETLYRPEAGRVAFIDEALFHTALTFPANVPTGDYRVEARLIRDGRVLSVRSTTLRIEKGGFSAEVFAFARAEEALYGLVAIALALVAGWLGGLAFRKG